MAERMDEAAAASRLMEIAIAHWQAELLLQAAEMSLADRFSSDEPRSAKDLAAEYGMRHRELYRYLRALTGLGLLTFAGPDSFRLTDLGAALRTGAQGAARSAFIALVGDMVKPAWMAFDHGLYTGDTGFEKAHGMGLFQYLQNNPGMAQFFSETMVGFHGREPSAVAEAYDFSGIGSLVDVGGASGNMLGHVLSTTCRMSWSTRRRCSKASVWLTGWKSSPAASSKAFPPGMTPTCCRTSSMTGTTARTRRFSGMCATR